MEYDDLDPSPTHDEATTSIERRGKKRIRNWTASDRARHRVFEKGRREAFNSRLMDLARLLPSLSEVKESQLSKHVIVEESVKQHEAQQAVINELTQNFEQLKGQQEQLLNELNLWRQSASLNPTAAEAFQEVLSNANEQPPQPGFASDELQHLGVQHETGAPPTAETLSLTHPNQYEFHDQQHIHSVSAPGVPNNSGFAFLDHQPLEHVGNERIRLPSSTPTRSELEKYRSTIWPFPVTDSDPISGTQLESSTATVPTDMEDLFKTSSMQMQPQTWEAAFSNLDYGQFDINALPFLPNFALANT